MNRSLAKASRSKDTLSIVDPGIQTIEEGCVRYNKEHEKTLYSQLQSPGSARVVKGRQNQGQAL